ncbi:MAG: methyltransferase domain-containing protein [Holophagales bacterium]|nr:methyltransferase domain-containing protein [Holophagales bacterium]
MEHSDPTRESYDALPYARLVHRFTHPERIARTARLRGFEPAPVSTARVLELGCASGDNLVGMAYGLPEASFVGVDLSDRQIEAGRRRVSDLGLENISLESGDLRDVDESWGAFDYVLAHGVLSWVPEPVRLRLFEVCRERLSPAGVAFVSYNALPGWRFRGLVRDVLLAGAAGGGEPRERVRLARERLALVAENVFDAASPWGRYLAARQKELENESDGDLLHEFLEDQNEAFSLRNVADRAAAAGLAYLGDAQEAYVPEEPVADEVRLALEALPGEIEREELLDVLRQRTLRQSLFVHAGGPARHRADATGVAGPRAGLEITPLSRAILQSPRPRASALARLQATEGSRVTSLEHRNVALDPLAEKVLVLLDGSRTVEEVAAACGWPVAIVEAVIEGLLRDALLEG